MKNFVKKYIKNALSPIQYDRLKDFYESSELNFRIACGQLTRLVNKPPIPRNHDGSVYLHLGCGKINHPAFINVDGIPDSHIHYVRKIDDLSPFKDDSIDLIYASHCLEHFSHRKVLSVLTEWRRVLKVGGTLRLSVPDFDTLVSMYQDLDNDLTPIMQALCGGQDYKYNFHYTAFNKSYMLMLLQQAGYENIREWRPGTDELTSLDDWSDKFIDGSDGKYPVSLNMEADKARML